MTTKELSQLYNITSRAIQKRAKRLNINMEERKIKYWNENEINLISKDLFFNPPKNKKNKQHDNINKAKKRLELLKNKKEDIDNTTNKEYVKSIFKEEA